MEHSYIIAERGGRSGTLRGPEMEPDFLLAVSPAGDVKTLRYSTNGMSSKLTAKVITRNARKVGITFVTLSEEAKQAGWRVLDDLFKAEDRMEDCETVYAWYRQVSYRKSGRVADLDPAYLPDALEGIRAEAGGLKKIDLPAPQKRGKKKSSKAGTAQLSDVPTDL